VVDPPGHALVTATPDGEASTGDFELRRSADQVGGAQSAPGDTRSRPGAARSAPRDDESRPNGSRRWSCGGASGHTGRSRLATTCLLLLVRRDYEKKNGFGALVAAPRSGVGCSQGSATEEGNGGAS